MASNPFQEKRTRSQVRLSDDILKLPELSPLKNARNAARNHPESSGNMDTTEDELLLLPDKQTKPSGSKRSVSPPLTNEYSVGTEGTRHERELKRLKWDSGFGDMKNLVKSRLPDLLHARINSEPSAGPGRKSHHKRAGSTSVSNKPHSTSDVPSAPSNRTPTGKSGKARAQSVPLFPSFSSLPQLDLRNPPMSPIRARSQSRSPDRYHGLRVHPASPEPSPSERAMSQDIPGESRVLMEDDCVPTLLIVIDGNTDVNRADELVATVPEVCIQPPQSPPTPLPQNIPVTQLPVTPVPSGLSLSISMSPLTPLPETPFPLKTYEENRYATKDGWSFQPEKEPETGSSLQPIPQPNFGTINNVSSTPKVSALTPRSQIPRPSMAPPIHLPPKMNDSESHAKQSPLKATAHKTSTSSTKNAFTLLMNSASRQDSNKSQDKGKGKSMIPRSIASTGTEEARGKGKEKVDPQAKKVSLKDRMRRKEKKKLDAPSKFIPTVFDDENDDFEMDTKPELQPPASSSRVLEVKPPSPPGDCDEFEIPTPLVLEGLSIVDPSSTHKSLPRPAEESGDNVRLFQPQKLTPDPSTTSQMESQSEHARMLDSEDVHMSPAPTVIDDEPPLEAKEQGTITPVPSDPPGFEMSEPPITPAIDHPVEQQASEAFRQQDEPVSQSHFHKIHPEQKEEAVVLKQVPKKRKQNNLPTSTRVTRSALRPPVPPPPKQARRQRALTTNSLPEKKATSSSISLLPPDLQGLPPGSPMRINSPLQTPSRNFRTPGSSPAKISDLKTPSKLDFSTDGSPSPTKIARAISMFRHPTDDIGVKTNDSSLSTLSEALDKLNTPAPSRPNTSLGFNPDTRNDDDDDMGIPQRNFESTIGRSLTTLSRDNSVKRPSTVGRHAGPSRTPASFLSSVRAGPSTEKGVVQKPVTMFFTRVGSSSSTSTPSNNARSAKSILLGGTRPSLLASFKGKGKGGPVGRGLNGAGDRVLPMANNRFTQKASKKTSLPTVEASPVKASGSKGFNANDGEDSILVDESLTMVEDDGTPSTVSKGDAASRDMGDIFMAPLEQGDELKVMETPSTEKRDGKGKEKDKSKSRDSSRRASLALSQLSQSLSAAPAFGVSSTGRMAPPALPRKLARSVSSSYPSTSSVSVETSTASANHESTDSLTRSPSRSPNKASGSGRTRASVRQAAKAIVNTEAKSPSTSSSQKASREKEKPSTKKSESLNILKDCRIFVDVRTDDGEEAGSLFVEMLESLGAKMQTRVGQACTHLIFKNGVMSTISRYRLLRDPKPFVVGIAWVVECVEQRQRVEETPFLIDLSEMNVAGTNKRRRSMLPKLIGNFVDSTAVDVEAEDAGEADVSMDGSTSSLTLDDDLTPLERARRRRSMIFGRPA